MSLTTANAIITLSLPLLFPAPIQLQGFAADDIFDIDSIKSVETSMGVDGILSGGFVYSEIPQNITLQADSASNDFFDMWWLQMQAAQDVYTVNGVVLLKSVSSQFSMRKGFLTGYKPAPDAKRTLQPRRHTITWERVAPSPML